MIKIDRSFIFVFHVHMMCLFLGLIRVETFITACDCNLSGGILCIGQVDLKFPQFKEISYYFRASKNKNRIRIHLDPKFFKPILAGFGGFLSTG